MSRFARIGEEAIRRQSELTGEEFRLYCLIVFHTWTESGVCNKNLQELSEIYGLTYNHTTERYKSLRKEFSKKLKNKEKERKERERIQKMESPWCENTKRGIRPLVGMKTPKIGVNEDNSNSENWSDEVQKSEFETPKIGVKTGSKLQKSELHIRNIEPFKDENFSASNSYEKPAAAAVETDGHKSIFSIEECLRYAEICACRGEPIKSVEALARHAYNSGEMDAFVSATLYPEQFAALEQTVEYDEKPADGDNLTRKEFDDALKLLIETVADGFDVSDWEKFYTPADWARLNEEAKHYK